MTLASEALAYLTVGLVAPWGEVWPRWLPGLGLLHGEVTYLTASVSTDLAEVNSANSAYVGGLVFAPYPQQFRAPFHRGPGPYDDTSMPSRA